MDALIEVSTPSSPDVCRTCYRSVYIVDRLAIDCSPDVGGVHPTAETPGSGVLHALVCVPPTDTLPPRRPYAYTNTAVPFMKVLHD